MPLAPPQPAADRESPVPRGRSTRQSNAQQERDAWSDEPPNDQDTETRLMLIARTARHSRFSSLSAATRKSYHVHSNGESAGPPGLAAARINDRALERKTAQIDPCPAH